MDEDKKFYCSLPKEAPRKFPEGLDENRQRLILALDTKWVNGTLLTYYLFQDGQYAGSANQYKAIREGFQAWKDIGIGLDFKEVTDINAAMVRIGFKKGDGSWSYVGRGILNGQIKPKERTMNIGWDNSQTLNTCIHEIGHTLGFPHEHQNPAGGIEWNEEAVYKSLGGPPNNWDREKTFYNIIRKISPDEIQSSQWDKDSIMHYPFEAGLINKPEIYQTQPLVPESGLSPLDKSRVLKFYPPMEDVKTGELTLDSPVPLVLHDGEQQRFSIKLASDKFVNIFTTGESDTVMVLFGKEPDGSLKNLKADDDSGENRNASIKYKLQGGSEYSVQVRVYWQSRSTNGEPAVMPKLHMVTSTESEGGGGESKSSCCCAIL